MSFIKGNAGGQTEPGGWSGQGGNYGKSGILQSLAGTKPDLSTDFNAGGQTKQSDKSGAPAALPDPQKSQGGPAPTLDDGQNTVAGTFKPHH
jgi:hypothetical protein